MTIAECNRRVRQAVSEKDDAIDTLLSEGQYRKSLLDMERSRIFSGIRADGTEIEPEYALFTIRVKTRKGQPTDRVTLFDTGAFYGAFTVERKGDMVIFTSTDDKTQRLVDKYGEGIFGLTDDDKAEARDMSIEYIIRWFKEKTNL